MSDVELIGKCAVCGKQITEDDYRQQEVVAAISSAGTVLCCARHLSADGPDGPQYHAAVNAMVAAVAKQLGASK